MTASSSSRLFFSVPVLLWLILAVFAKSGLCIHCWECNSVYTPSCLDDFQSSAIAYVDCDQRQDEVSHLEVPDGQEELPRATLCRKTIQDVEGDYRIIRSCGWVKNSGQLENRTCFNRAGTNQIQMYHCVCDHDGCNGDVTLKSVGIIFLLLFHSTLALIMR